MASGVTSRGVTPVPPTEITRSTPPITAVFSALRISISSAETTTTPSTTNAGLAEQFGDQRSAVIFLVTVRGAVVDDDDERAAHQLTRLFHERNRISRRRRRRGHFQRGAAWRDGHCAAFPRVTCTVCGLPDGSR